MRKPKKLREIKVSWLGCAGARAGTLALCPESSASRSVSWLVELQSASFTEKEATLKGNWGFFRSARRMIVDIRTC